MYIWMKGNPDSGNNKCTDPEMGASVACGQGGGRVVGAEIKEVVGDELMWNVVGQG